MFLILYVFIDVVCPFTSHHNNHMRSMWTSKIITSRSIIVGPRKCNRPVKCKDIEKCLRRTNRALHISDFIDTEYIHQGSEKEATEKKRSIAPQGAAFESLIHRDFDIECNIQTKETNQFLWKLVVGGICFLWGTNFATIRQIFNDVPDLDPSIYASLRFGIAALVFTPSYIGRLGDSKLVRRSFLCGIFVFIGYIGQAIGLANGSTPEKSAFIASLCVVWVPILHSMTNNDWTKQKWGSTFLAVAGIAFLELEGTSSPNIGDLWSFLQPLGFGTSYILIEQAGKAMEKDRKERLSNVEDKDSLENNAITDIANISEKSATEDAAASTGLQLLSIALLSTGFALLKGNNINDFIAPLQQSNTATIDLLYTGLITTALAIYAQTLVSTKVKSTDIAIILAGEPIFATVYAALILGESVSVQDMFGGLLVIISCLAAEVDLPKLAKSQKKSVA